MKKLLATLSLTAVAAFALTACGTKASQGVYEDKIVVGNTAATTGAFAAVGVPFNDGLEAVFKTWNDVAEHKQKLELKHYDDEFDGAKGLDYTKKLVEQDKVFALVGHFGTNTVAATVDYIREVGVPMVYAATGINDLYSEGEAAVNNPVMPLQPIYKTEGRVLLARALATGEHGLGGTKIGVISTTDDAGKGILEGIKRQAEETTAPITYAETNAATGTNHTTAVNTLKNASCDVVIIAANQAPFGEILTAMRDANYNAKVITSYVSADAATLNNHIIAGSITADRPVYTTAWLDIASSTYVWKPADTDVVGQFVWACYKALVAGTVVANMYDAGVPGFSEEYWEAAMAIADFKMSQINYDYTNPKALDAFTSSYNSYALAGYIAGRMFTHGLSHIEGTITWEKYIKTMEANTFDIPMGGVLELADAEGNAQRLGVTSLALNRADHAAGGIAGSLVSVDGILTLEQVWDSVPASLKK